MSDMETMRRELGITTRENLFYWFFGIILGFLLGYTIGGLS